MSNPPTADSLTPLHPGPGVLWLHHPTLTMLCSAIRGRSTQPPLWASLLQALERASDPNVCPSDRVDAGLEFGNQVHVLGLNGQTSSEIQQDLLAGLDRAFNGIDEFTAVAAAADQSNDTAPPEAMLLKYLAGTDGS